MLKFGKNIEETRKILFRLHCQRPFAIAGSVEEGGCDLADFVDLLRQKDGLVVI